MKFFIARTSFEQERALYCGNNPLGQFLPQVRYSKQILKVPKLFEKRINGAATMVTVAVQRLQILDNCPFVQHRPKLFECLTAN